MEKSVGCQKIVKQTFSSMGLSIIKPSLLICVLAATLFGQQSTLHKKDIATIAKEANGAVVSIVMSDKEGHPLAYGSGFLISKDGWIVTNYHVIKTGSSAMIKLPDGAFLPVDGVVASDKGRDVAIIKANGNDFRTVTLGDSARLHPRQNRGSSVGVYRGSRLGQRNVSGLRRNPVPPTFKTESVRKLSSRDGHHGFPVEPGASGRAWGNNRAVHNGGGFISMHALSVI
ncbi:MAG: trypsin-like peptidase domain-containing protein [Terriglobales bacterium]